MAAVPGMIVVRVELWSAVNGCRTELARMHICNDGASDSNAWGNYDGTTFRGRDAEALDKHIPNRKARVEKFPRQSSHVWNLVNRMLTRMGYNQ